MASYCRQYTGAAPYEVSLNFPLRHRCSFIRQIYFHIGKPFEGRGGKEPGVKAVWLVHFPSFQLPSESLVLVLALLWRGPYTDALNIVVKQRQLNIGTGHSVLPLEAHQTPKTKARNHRACLLRRQRLVFR